MVAAVQIQNLVYVAGALAVATLVSGLIVLRHRKPKSLEAGIESFSRELKALAPERRPPAVRESRSAPDGESSERRRGVRARPIVRSGASRVGRHSPASASDSSTGTSPGSNRDAGDQVGIDDSGRPETGGNSPPQKASSAPEASADPKEGAHFHALEGQETDVGDHPGRSGSG